MWLFNIFIHFLLGFGILQRFGPAFSAWEKTGLAYPLGLGTATFLTFLLDIFGLPLFLNLGVAALAAVGLFLPEILAKTREKHLRIRIKTPAISMPEAALLTLLFLLLFISFWRAYYVPVTPYDAIVGIDLVAKYALLDGRIDSRMFSDLAGQLNTQPYYAPFAMLSQVLYRSAGLPLGQVWLPLLTFGFILTFYANFRREAHPLIAGLLAIMLLSVPEMYGYTFLLQTDFSNAVFVSLGILYLFRYLKNPVNAHFWLAAILFGLGCWSRSETIAFTALTAVLFFVFRFKKDLKDALTKSAFFIAISLPFFLLWNSYYLPEVLDYHPESLLKFFFWNPARLEQLFSGMVRVSFKIEYWGYVPFIFFALTLVNILIFRDVKNLFLLLWVTAMFAGFLILLYHLQLPLYANINYTYRRGSFKMWPVTFYYIATSAIFQQISAKIKQWETS